MSLPNRPIYPYMYGQNHRRLACGSCIRLSGVSPLEIILGCLVVTALIAGGWKLYKYYNSPVNSPLPMVDNSDMLYPGTPSQIMEDTGLMEKLGKALSEFRLLS